MQQAKAKKQETEKKTAETNVTQKKTARVTVNAVLRGSYGAFNPGETVEIEKSLAESFIKGGYAVKAE